MAGLIWTVGIALVCYIGLGIVFRHLKTYSRDDLSHLIRSLLIKTENGAYCRLDHKGSDVWLSFERASGAKGSHAARIFLETLGVPIGARFKAIEVGQPSRRALENLELVDKN